MVETFIFFCCCCVFLRLKNIRNVRALQFTITSGGMVIIITNFFVCLRVPEGLGFFVFFSTLIIFRFASLLFVCSMPPAVYLWRMLYYGINYSLRLYYQTKNICHVFFSSSSICSLTTFSKWKGSSTVDKENRRMKPFFFAKLFSARGTDWIK